MREEFSTEWLFMRVQIFVMSLERALILFDCFNPKAPHLSTILHVWSGADVDLEPMFCEAQLGLLSSEMVLIAIIYAWQLSY